MSISKTFIEATGNSLGYEGLAAAKALLQAGKATESELLSLVNAGYNLDDILVLANHNILPSELSQYGITNSLEAGYASTLVKAGYSSEVIEQLASYGIKPSSYLSKGITTPELAEGTAGAIETAAQTSTRTVIQSMSSFMDDLGAVLQIEGIDFPTYTSLRITPPSMLSPEEIKMLVRIRESVPMPTTDTLLSKAISMSTRKNFLNNGQYSNTIGGFFSTAQDTKGLFTSNDYYSKLRLDYASSEFDPEFITIVRFKTRDISAIKIPYGGISDADLSAMEFATGIPRSELVKNAWPYSGYGVTVTEGSMTVPEYVTKTNQYMPLEDKAAMYDIYKNGTEKLKAVFTDGVWITVD